MRFIDKKESRELNGNILVRPDGISDEQWERALDLYEVAKRKGDRFPALTVAQGALETGWFKHLSGNYNYFGQKATNNQKGSDKITNEYEDNKKITIVDKFRDYDSLDEAVEDRIKKWGSKYSDAKNINEAIGKIWSYDKETGKGRGYATDINYDRKLNTILSMMGVDAGSKKSDNNDPSLREQRNRAMEARLQDNLMKVDNTDTRTVDVSKVQEMLQPLVTNNIEQVTVGKTEVEKARDKIETEQNKLDFIQRLIKASEVSYIEPIESQEQGQTSFQDGGIFDPEGTGYDYETAKKYGIEPDSTGHWPSRVPETGQLLKGIKHDTFYKTVEGEEKAGYKIVKGKDGKYYSQPIKNNKLSFQDGGKLSDKEIAKNEKNAKDMYFPIVEKIANTYGTIEDEGKYPKIHPYVQKGIDKALDFSINDLASGRRKIPEMDEDMKELQKMIIDMPEKELRELLSQDYSKVNMFNFTKYLPKGLSLWKALKYQKKFNSLINEGYTFQDGGKVVGEDEKEFLLEYIQSPKYRERLENSGYYDIDDLINKRINNIKGTTIQEVSGLPKTAIEKLNSALTGDNYSSDPPTLYNSVVNGISLNRNQIKSIGSEFREGYAHELGHAEVSAVMDNADVIVPDATSMNYKDLSELRNRNKLKGKSKDYPTDSFEREVARHEENPIESKADLNALRTILKQDNIYDAGKEDFKMEHLEKAPDSFTKKRLLEKYSKEDLIWLMNNIAMNEEVKSDKKLSRVYRRRGTRTNNELSFNIPNNTRLV